MANVFVEVEAGNLSTYSLRPPVTYRSSSLGLGSQMTQISGAAFNQNTRWFGPNTMLLGRPVEEAAAIPAAFPCAVRRDDTTDWVFFSDGAAVANNRRVQLYVLDRNNDTFSWQGYITTYFPPAVGNITVRGFRVDYIAYATGTVAVNGTLVTGSGTYWMTDRLATGGRIFFGSNTSSLAGVGTCSAWYNVASMSADTSMSLETPAGTWAAGTPYLFEETRILQLAMAANLTSSSLFITKGVHPGLFVAGGTSIPYAPQHQDHKRLTYGLRDAATSGSIVSGASGLGLEPRINHQTHYAWAIIGTGNTTLLKFNTRASCSFSASMQRGNETAVLSSSVYALTGTATQLNNGRLATLGHGPGIATPCLYWTSNNPSRVWRSPAVSTLSTGSTPVADVMIDLPPGGVATYALPAAGGYQSIEHSEYLDRFIIPTLGTTIRPFYLTQYRTDPAQLDRLFGMNIWQLGQSAATADSAPALTGNGLGFYIWTDGGRMYAVRVGTTALTNIIYVLPLGGDWDSNILSSPPAGSQYVVLPKMLTPNANRYLRLYVNEEQYIGGVGVPAPIGAGGNNLALPTEPWRAYYRTSATAIATDATSSWTALSNNNDLSGIQGTDAIQFMFEFRTAGLTCIPARIHSVGVLYSDLSTDSHYQPSVANSNITTKVFAWRFSTAFGGTVPNLRIRLYDAVTNGLLLDDTSASPLYGAWAKSTAAVVSWGAYDTVDKANDTTYIKYTPTSIGDNIRVRALLTLA